MVSEWQEVEFKDILNESDGVRRGPFGSALKKEFFHPSNPYPVYEQQNAIYDRYNTRYKISEEKFQQLNSFELLSGDFIMSGAGTIGKISRVPEGIQKGVFNQALIRFRINKQKIDSDFFLFMMRSPMMQEQLISGNPGSAISNLVPIEELKKYKILLPSIEEQERISIALSDTENSINSVSELIKKKQLIKESALEDLITGKRRLKGFDNEWKNINLGETSLLKARIGWQGLTTSEYLESGFAYLITGTDFKKGKINWKNIHFVEKHRYDQDKNIQLRDGDLLLTKDGTIGKVALVKNLNKPTTLNSGVFVIRPTKNRYLTEYVYYVLTSSIFKTFLNKLAAGSTISHLYQKDLTNFEFLLPSSLKEQKNIAIILSDMDEEIFKLEEKLEKYKKIKQGMMEQLLTGKIRLT